MELITISPPGATIGHDYSFNGQSVVMNRDIVPLELANYTQQQVSFGWLRSDKPNALLLQQFIIHFQNDLKSIYRIN
ncbi:hypothetical protein I6N90_17965 [Paenibacillus sp. GSMTC-2017]|uniref:hypothetical protein n=1 Tax=Paenibacillus sp. GSMTC-2017 TaxID=2794350 RepID=UPI0018D698AA|nr:hypothetical protein [Paenibacillus sp. GSMTC-2017]MBH5319686.1 hypothetical protein [Paenibacillus sp. GSMTC-2017]